MWIRRGSNKVKDVEDREYQIYKRGDGNGSKLRLKSGQKVTKRGEEGGTRWKKLEAEKNTE